MHNSRVVISVALALAIGVTGSVANSQGKGSGKGKGDGDAEPVELALGYISEPKNGREEVALSAIDGSGETSLIDDGGGTFLILNDIARADKNLAIVQRSSGATAVRWDLDDSGRPTNISTTLLTSGYTVCAALSRDGERYFYSPAYSSTLRSVGTDGGGDRLEFNLGPGKYFDSCSAYYDGQHILATVLDSDPSATDAYGMGLAKVPLTSGWSEGYIIAITPGLRLFELDVAPGDTAIAYRDFSANELVVRKSGAVASIIPDGIHPKFDCTGKYLAYGAVEQSRRGSKLSAVIRNLATGDETIFSGDSKRRFLDWYC